MRYVKIKSLPHASFAHVFGASSYENHIPVKRGRMEICYIAEGINHSAQNGRWITEEKYDVTCNFYECVTHVKTESFHEHHTVSASFEFETTGADLEGALYLPRLLKCGERKKLHDLIDEIISVYSSRPNSEALFSGLFLQVMAEYDELARAQTEERRGGSSAYVRKAKAYVYANLRRPLTQRGVAYHLGITPEYLCYAFKKAGEEPFVAFLNKTKLSQLREVMRRENLRLYEAAEMFGYADPNYVSRLYKKYFGKNITESL